MNSDLTPAQNTTATGNPQALQQSAPGASDSNSFQKAAGTDVLNQNRPLQVISTGKPIEAQASKAGSVATLILVVAIIVVALVAAVTWAIKKPDTAVKKPENKEPEAPKAPLVKVTHVSESATVVKKSPPKGKKKQPRSKRQK